jgi:hypothetical protein
MRCLIPSLSGRRQVTGTLPVRRSGMSNACPRLAMAPFRRVSDPSHDPR